MYPPRDASRETIDYLYKLPGDVRRIYSEVVTAMNASLSLLAAIGLRTLIEAICVDRHASGKNLENRIEDLADIGSLSKAQAQILHSHRFLGNLAAHEIQAPDAAELIAALEIAETILKTLYIIPTLQKEIKIERRSPPTPLTKIIKPTETPLSKPAPDATE